eukprot:PhM_4_TR9580/c0_g2_i1/m.31333
MSSNPNVTALCHEASLLPNDVRAGLQEIGRLDFRLRAVKQRLVMVSEGAVIGGKVEVAESQRVIRALEDELADLCHRKENIAHALLNMAIGLRDRVDDLLET